MPTYATQINDPWTSLDMVLPVWILRLMKIYYYDFLLFGYTFDIETYTAGGIF